jgi:hypothetical protein
VSIDTFKLITLFIARKEAEFMLKKICTALSVWVLLQESTVMAESFRGLPYYAKVTKVNPQAGAYSPTHRLVEVCYRWSTTIPIMDYTDFASRKLKGLSVKRRDQDGGALSGDTQEFGVELKFRALGLDFYAYLDSERQEADASQLVFFNSYVDQEVGVKRPTVAQSFSVSYDGMFDPQYEWVDGCLRKPFPRGYSDRYVTSLFEGPGPIGSVGGQTAFLFRVFPPSFISRDPLTIDFLRSDFVSPLFGRSELTSNDYKTIALAHSINSLNVVREQLDEAALNKYLQSNQDIVRSFEEAYGVTVPMPLDADGLVRIIREVSSVDELPPPDEGF